MKKIDLVSPICSIVSTPGRELILNFFGEDLKYIVTGNNKTAISVPAWKELLKKGYTWEDDGKKPTEGGRGTLSPSEMNRYLGIMKNKQLIMTGPPSQFYSCKEDMAEFLIKLNDFKTILKTE